MRAISIKQPWATLIVKGIKNVENRSWTSAYRGELVIHASKSGTDADMEAGRRLCSELGVEFPAEFPTGGFVGVVDLAGVITTGMVSITTDHPTFKITDARGYTEQEFGWILENPRTIPFVAARGKLGLFIPDMTVPVGA